MADTLSLNQMIRQIVRDVVNEIYDPGNEHSCSTQFVRRRVIQKLGELGLPPKAVGQAVMFLDEITDGGQWDIWVGLDKTTIDALSDKNDRTLFLERIGQVAAEAAARAAAEAAGIDVSVIDTITDLWMTHGMTGDLDFTDLAGALRAAGTLGDALLPLIGKHYGLGD